MSEENGDSKATLPTPWGPASFSGKKMAEFISILLLCMFGILSYAFWEHTRDADKNNTLIAVAIKEIASSNLQLVREQRVTNCLISLEPKDRQGQLATCERIAK